MDETYTPSTSQVRTHWAGDGVEKERRVAEFDRWFEGQRVEARTVTAEQVEAAAARIRRVYLGDRIRNHTREEARILVAAVLQAAGFTTPEE